MGTVSRLGADRGILGAVCTSSFVPSTDGVQVRVHDFGGDGPDLLLCHATGMHGMVWSPVIGQLTGSFRCVALDFRGHGDSAVPVGSSLAWTGMADDVLAVVDGLGLVGALRAAGWSMGGCALALAGLERRGLWRAAWAMEPIIFGADTVEISGATRGNALADSARRRREVFATRDEAIANYASKPPFDRAEPAALRAYVNHGFEDLDDGTVRLKCRGETEARLFELSVTETGSRLGELDFPFTVVASGDGFPPALVAPWVASQLGAGTLERMEDLSHFAPMEDPTRVAASIRRAVA